MTPDKPPNSITIPLLERFPCLAMQVESDSRVGLPADVLKAAGWIEGATLNLVAALLDPGLALLRLASDVKPQLDELMAGIGKGSNAFTEPEVKQLQLLGDAYQSIRFTRRDGRIRLTEELLLHLGHDPNERPWLFIQAGLSEVLVMSRDFRTKRLAASRRSLR
jgi:hypothetical protein